MRCFEIRSEKWNTEVRYFDFLISNSLDLSLQEPTSCLRKVPAGTSLRRQAHISLQNIIKYSFSSSSHDFSLSQRQISFSDSKNFGSYLQKFVVSQKVQTLLKA